MFSPASFKRKLLINIIIFFIFAIGFHTKAISKENMEVERDKDKTTYTIGPSEKSNRGKTGDEKERERAWDMLKNMNIIIDKQGKSGQKNGKGSGEGNGQR